MNLSKLNYSISHFLSGFIFLVSFIAIWKQWDYNKLSAMISYHKDILVAIGFAVIAISIFIGLIFDAIREVWIEWLYDWLLGKKNIINHEFFFYKEFKFENEEISGEYYDYYIMDLNIAVGMLIIVCWNFLILCGWCCTSSLVISLIVYLVILFIFVADSVRMRKRIAKEINRLLNK